MAPARSSARVREERRAAPAPPRPKVVRAPAKGGIRWDRVGRMGLLIVLLGLVYLYVGPTISYIETWREAGSRRAEVQQLKLENRQLRARRQAMQDPRVLEREARRLGMVKPGERGYIVKGLPR